MSYPQDYEIYFYDLHMTLIRLGFYNSVSMEQFYTNIDIERKDRNRYAREYGFERQ